MGDVVMSWNRRSWPRVLTYGLAAAALVGGCSAGGGEVVSPPVAEVSSAPAAQAEAPVVVTGLTLREAAPGMRLDVEANGPVVWTQYRDAEGRLVLELPNAVTAPDVAGLVSEYGLVEAVGVDRIDGVGRPLVRVTIAFREPGDGQLSKEGNTLRVALAPVGAPQGDAVASAPLTNETLQGGESAAAAEPLPIEPLESAVTVAEVSPAPASGVPATGTPDAPTVGGTEAASATRLSGVELLSREGGVGVVIRGDGRFAWKAFRLSAPERLVIDLDGVTNAASGSAITGDGRFVDRVRVAQFQTSPEAISRVVVDLAGSTEARVLETESGLEVLFGEGQPGPTMIAEAEAAPRDEQSGTFEPVPTPDEQVPMAEPAAVAQAEPPPESPKEPAPVVVASAPATPAPSPAVVTPQPRQVALFEALDMPQESAPTVGAAEAPNYAALEVGEVETKYTGEPINFALRDADIREVLRTFAKLSGLNVIVQPGVTGSVTVQFEQVPWDQALEQILKINGLWYELEGNIMRIAPRDVLNAEAAAEAERRKAVELSVPLRTIVKRVSYASAGEVAGLLRSGGQGGLLSQRGSVTIDARTNTLIIKELPSFMDSVLAIIEELDEPEPQVLIEARIVETTKRTSRSLGIAWGFEGNANAALGNTTGLDFPNNIASEGSVNLLTGGQNGLIGITLGNVLDSFILDAQLQAAESDGLINILSTPKIATLNNERAEIQSGLQIPIQTVSNNTVTVQFVNATLRLSVTPQVTAEGTVLMDIDIQKREPQLAFAIAGAANAPIATKEAKTRVIVRDGGTTVIGGIYEVSADQGQDRVPGLANIPFLGRLFKNNRRTDENEELLIFITPRVIKI